MNNSSNFSRINRVRIFDELANLEKQYLTELREANIKLFASEAKKLVDNSFDDFILAQEQTYTKDSLKGITDKNVLLAFTDIKTGYRRRMRDWVEAHPVETAETEVSVEELEEKLPLHERAAFRHSVAALGIGTVSVVGLRILTGSSWVYLAELGVLAAAGHLYQRGKKIDEQRTEVMRHQQEVILRKKVAKAIREDLVRWIDTAEEENRNVLKSFNIE
jgi:hypothetical protein